MLWLSSPKVRLALIVNGLYFISLFTPTTPHSRPRLFAHAYENNGARVAPKKPQVFAALPPPSGPSKATTWVNNQHDQLDVYLTNDLTLVSRPRYRLLLSPTFTTRASNPEAPDTVLLRFVSFSDDPTPSGSNWVTITADGENMWYENVGIRYGGNVARQSDTEGNEGDGYEVVKTVGINMPYELFVETISARQVVVQFGPDRVELTVDQIEALRDMHRRLPQQLEDPAPSGNHPGRPYGGIDYNRRITPVSPTTRPPARRHQD